MENKELLQKARQTKSVEELLALAKENEYPLDEENARELFDNLHNSGELSDEELDNVSGGGCGTPSRKYDRCPVCHSPVDITVTGKGYGIRTIWKCRRCGWHVDTD